MTTLYDVLGVKKGATPEEIHGAKRKLARKHHPDRGGSTERMALINRAADVLEDEKKRAHYDATGQETVPDPEDDAMKLFIETLAQALNNPELAIYQVLSATREILEKRKIDAVEAREQIMAVILKLEKRLGKSKYKGKKTNMIEAITRANIEGLRQKLEIINMIVKTKLCQRAIKYLNEYEALDETSQAGFITYYVR